MKVSLVLLPSWRRDTPSLGIAYLSSHLIEAGHTVFRHEFNLSVVSPDWVNYFKEINLNWPLRKNLFDGIYDSTHSSHSKLNKYADYCANIILRNNSDVVGFSTYDCNANINLVVAKRIKELNHKTIIVFGGPDTSLKGHKARYLNTGFVDYVMQGEGERSFPRLLDCICNDIPFENKDWVPEPNIDSFEFPIFRQTDILKSNRSFILPLTTNRGCVGNCDFCYQTRIWKCFRQRSPKNVIDEIKYQLDTHNIHCFNFNDSSINSDFIFLREFSKQLLIENLDIKWGGNANIRSSLSPSVLKTMFDSGCRYLYYGVESGSNNVLAAMKKGTTVDLIERVLKDTHDSGIWVHIYIMVGYPAETEEDFIETLKFVARNLKYIDSINLSPFNTFRPTRLPITLKTRLRRMKDFNKIFKYLTSYSQDLFFKKSYVNFKITPDVKLNSSSFIDWDVYQQIVGSKTV